MSFARLFVACVALFLWDLRAAHSQEAREGTKTSVYDIRDMLMARREYPAESSLIPPTRIGERRAPVSGESRATTRASANTPNSRAKLVEDILSLIKETVDPDSWRDNGGTIGSIRELQGQLIVTQTQENHRQLAVLLTQLREHSARMVTVRAQWLFLAPADLKAVAKPLERNRTLMGVDRAALEKLESQPTCFYGQVTCFNAQTVHIVSGRAQTVVTEQVPVVGGGDAVGYEPKAEFVQGGTLLEVTPVLTPDGTMAMLDLQSVASEWHRPPSNPQRVTQPAAPATAAPDIDRIDMTVQHMRTSVALPVNQPVIVGGMTFGPIAGAGTNEMPQLYLVIEVTGSAGDADAPSVRPSAPDEKAR